MIFDKKSDVKEFKATPGNPQNNSLSIDLSQKSVDIPLQQNGLSIPLVQNGLSIPIQQSGADGFQYNDNSLSIPVTASIKTLDILSLEAFGHNANYARKDQGILEATQVNTDKLSGIIQIDDKFDLTEATPTSIGYVEVAGNTTYYGKTFFLSTTTASTQMTSLTITPAAEQTIIVPSQPAYSKYDSGTHSRYGGFFYLQTDDADGVITVNGLPLTEDAAAVTPNLSELGVLSSAVNGFNFDGAIKKIALSITNKGTDPIWFWYRQKYSKFDAWEYSGMTSAGVIVSAGGTENLTHDRGGENCVAELYIGNDNDINNATLVLYPRENHTDGYDLNRYSFQVNPNTSFTSWEYNGTSNLPTSKTNYGLADYNEMTITLRVWSGDAGVVSDNTILRLFITNSGTGASVKIKAADPLMLDYSLGYDYFYANTSSTLVSLEPYVITSCVNYNKIYLCNASGSQTLYRTDPSPIPTNDDMLDEFYQLLEVSDTFNIGIAKRVSGNIQLCVKAGDIYITAKNDVAISNTSIFSKVRIVEVKDHSLAFLVNIYVDADEEYDAYFKLNKIKDMNLGKLYDDTTKELYVFKRINVNSILSDSDKVINQDVLSGIYSSVSIRSITTDDNIYLNTSKPVSVRLDENSVITTITSNSLEDTYMAISDPVDYVSKGFVLPIPYGFVYGLSNIDATSPSIENYDALQGSCYWNIFTLPKIDATLKTYATLPIRLEDEFPGIANNSPVGIDYAIIGKTGFVFTGSSLYENSGLKLIANVDRLYLSETGKMFFNFGFFFIAKENLTNVYTFSELGMQLQFVIEDQILTTPVKTSVGIIACGVKAVWFISQEGVMKSYVFESDNLKASIKTAIDNSCLICTYGGDETYYNMTASVTGNIIYSLDPAPASVQTEVTTARPNLLTVNINQFGHISTRTFETVVSEVNFIDIGDASTLIVLDNSNNTIYTLDKEDAESGDDFYLTSNQQVEFYGRSAEANLIRVKFFAKGTGVIRFYFNGSVVATHTETLSGITRYTEYSFRTDIAYSMMSYRIVVDSGILMMARIIGYLNIKETL